ncbi:ParA family protein [candidate division CSSED10-310 bacterium]|uniref:ParA family protein n=1 Tax=candidate division CSSED10-310 bacterium TaxID=2855610 RepID=A0ABV6YV81_UNCC1
MKTDIIAVTNQKGGVGKTTTALNTASALAKRGKSVLLIDMDPQAHCGIGLGLDVYYLEHHIGTILRAMTSSIKDAIMTTDFINLDLIPSHEDVVKIEKELFQRRGREWVLQRLLRKLDDYEIIIIDTPPNLGILTENALCAANWVLIPCQMSYYAVEGTFALMNVIDQFRYELDHEIKVLGVLPTFYDQRTRASKLIVQELKDYFKDLVFNQWIRTNVRLNEAQKNRKVIFDHDPGSNGAHDYWEFSAELLTRLATK